MSAKSKDRLQGLLAKARRTNATYDRIDRQHGFSPPADCPIGTHIHTAICALEAGISTEDWDCVAEATVMLQDLLESRDLPR